MADMTSNCVYSETPLGSSFEVYMDLKRGGLNETCKIKIALQSSKSKQKEKTDTKVSNCSNI